MKREQIENLGWSFNERVRDTDYFSYMEFFMGVNYYAVHTLIDVWDESHQTDLGCKLYIQGIEELKVIMKQLDLTK